MSTTTLTSPPQIGNVSNWQRVANLRLSEASDAEIAEAINAQLVIGDRMLTQWARTKAQTGVFLIMVREMRDHGEFGKFLAAHFSDKSRRTITNWMRAAENFCIEEGIAIDRKSVKKLEPIIQTQMELFDDPEAKLDKIVRKFKDYTENRSLRDMIKGEASLHEPDDEPKPKRNTLPPSPNNAKRLRGDDAATTHADAINTRDTVKELVETEFFKDLDDTELHDFALWLVKWSDTVTTAAKARR